MLTNGSSIAVSSAKTIQLSLPLQCAILGTFPILPARTFPISCCKRGHRIPTELVGERNRTIPLRSISNLRGEIETVFRRDIAQLSGSGLSLMPEGLEAAISVEQMADLIAFLLLPP